MSLNVNTRGKFWSIMSKNSLTKILVVPTTSPASFEWNWIINAQGLEQKTSLLPLLGTTNIEHNHDAGNA